MSFPRRLIRAATPVFASVLVAVLVATTAPGWAGEAPPPPQRGGAWANCNGNSATGTATDSTGGQSGSSKSGSSGGRTSSGPRCWYEPLQFTTQDEQRTTIRPWEQRPGVWGWWVCDDGSETFGFFPEGAPSVDPETLAESVTITPTVPPLRTSPPLGSRQLVNFATWFWVDATPPLDETATAGGVSVRVIATARELVIDPGDGTGTFTCAAPGTPCDTTRPASAQSSDCTHTYRAAGDFSGSVTVVYSGRWEGTGGGGELADIRPTDPFTISVTEGQAIVVD